jgi:hypothetical protein
MAQRLAKRPTLGDQVIGHGDFMRRVTRHEMAVGQHRRDVDHPQIAALGHLYQ